LKQRHIPSNERQTRREYISGESHYFQGARYLLNVIEQPSPGRVVIRNKKKIDLYVRPQSTLVQRERIMLAWYRAYLKQTIPPLIDKWEQVIGVQVADWGVKQMKTRWGSCNIPACRIWINLELAKKSSRCLEYIVVHEMVHLLERHHNDILRAYMDKFLPQWRQYRQELNRSPLSHQDWDY